MEYGRRILDKPDDSTDFIEMSSMVLKNKYVQCMRCEQYSDKNEVYLPDGGYFCPHCIELGRVRSKGSLYWIPERKRHCLRNTCTWRGELTKEQEEISQKIVKAVKFQGKLLIYAVTGAGKTEMLFMGIEEALSQGKRVGIVSPRVDVCLELYPRICVAFQELEIALLHGKNEKMYYDSSLVIATTHQLLRFYQAFDVLIVDEVDAFPFINEKKLEVGVKNALKKEATLIYLTATPTEFLLESARRGKLEEVILPARFHRHELVVPKFRWVNQWYLYVVSGKLPKEFLKIMNELFMDNFPFLIFCPSIEWMSKLEKLLQKEFPEKIFASVSAEDKDRIVKVQNMRDFSYDFLLTTSILERGVTFPKISVIIFGANHRIFTKSALIQISGRVGRNHMRPGGKLYFLHDGKSKAMISARKEIKKMNNLAKKRRLIQ
ncbi:MAG: DEAD/DEAH box helicase [Lactobacillales bacterium]|jgi:competence protein ComFA|nr:DEAD/DEAH box helicase [Lactobacillales bacterium]